MMKILFTMIFSLSLGVFAQEGPAPKGEATEVTNSSPVDDKKVNTDCQGDADCAKTVGLNNTDQKKTQAGLNPKDKSACTNCSQPVKNRLTSNKGALKDKVDPFGMTYDQIKNTEILNSKKVKKVK